MTRSARSAASAQSTRAALSADAAAMAHSAAPAHAAPRCLWRGLLKLARIACPVRLYAATGAADRGRLVAINAATGNKVDVQHVDAITGAPVAAGDLAQGIEVAAGGCARITDAEIAAAAPPSATAIEIEELVPAAGIDWLYPDGLYYLGPDWNRPDHRGAGCRRPGGVGPDYRGPDCPGADARAAGAAAGAAFALIRDGIRRSRLVALGRLSLHNRERLVMLRPGEKVLRLATLRHAAELRSEQACFAGLPDLTAPADLADPVFEILAARAVDAFDPSRFIDRYAAALAALVENKIAGRERNAAAPRPPAAALAEPPARLDLRAAIKRSFDNRAKPQRRKPQHRKRGRAA